MATTYIRCIDQVSGGYTVVQVTDDPEHTVVAKVANVTRANQIAALLTADEA